MKFYSHKIYRQHLEDLESFKDSDEVRHAFLKWPQTLANQFDRSYPRVGILDLNDLLMEAYHAFYVCWEGLKWDMIMSRPSNERIAMITSFLKKRIKNRISRAIARDRDTIRIPERYYTVSSVNGSGEEVNYQTDIFITRTFSSFFDPDVLDKAEDMNNYVADQLNDAIHDFITEVLSSIEKTVVKQFYGIDEAYDKNVSVKRIAEYCKTTETNIKVIKHRALKKMKNSELLNNFEKIILNIVTN